MDPEQKNNELEPAEEIAAAEVPDAEAAAARAKELKRRVIKYGLFGLVFLVMGVLSARNGDVKTTIFAAVMTILCGFAAWRVTKKK